MNKNKKSYDYNLIREKALMGPRVTSLLGFFEEIASGKKQKPHNSIVAAQSFLDRDIEYKIYHEIIQKNIGNFSRHGFSSTPFLLEEVIRVGVAICKLAKAQWSLKERPLTYYETSSAEGTVGRSLAEYSNGLFKTLTDSPNRSNMIEFQRLLTHNYSYFHNGSFVDISPEYLHQAHRNIFADGFNIIWENTTFQMYGNNREEQIAYVCRLLKKDGLMIFFEKMNHCNKEEYGRLEHLKDSKFKARYFTKDEIDLKKLNILTKMEIGQVTLDEFALALKPHFRYAYIIWNSGNFYEIAASNDIKTINSFISYLSEPYVPKNLIINTSVVPLF